ncbi:MAG: apolipoprotein N-acyltransferase [Spongiibacteraceae bacterium]
MLQKLFGPGWAGHLLALIAGTLITLSLAPFDYWPLGLLSLLLLNRLLQTLTPKQAAVRGWWFGVGLFGTGISWVYVSIHDFGAASVPLAGAMTGAFVLSLALMHAMLGYCHARWIRPLRGGTTFGFAAWWTLGEWVRIWLFTGFPWLFVGYAHVQTPLAGWAPIIGIFGLSFIVAFGAASMAAMLGGIKRALPALAVSVLFWISGAALQQMTWTQPIGDPVRVALVQANIPQSMKWDREHYLATLETYRAMSEPLWERAQIVIWPEAAITNFYDNARDFLDSQAALARRSGSSLITGIPTLQRGDQTSEARMLNSAVAFDREAVSFYHKRHLVPFGEYIPFERQLRGLIQFLDMPMSDFVAGPDQQGTLDAGPVRFATSICYEVVYPDIARATAASNALLTISNDAWFGHSIGPLQHLQMAQMRALESGRPMIRATGNGVTALIDERGRITTRIPQFEAAVLLGSFQPTTGLTPLARTGSWPALAFCGLLLGLLGGFSRRLL